MIRFPVDDVIQAPELLPTQPLGELFPEAIAVGANVSLSVIAPDGVHALLIRQRVDVIAMYGLEKWCRSLIPIADQFVRTASGDVDTAFWQRIYNPADAYGGELITGWMARFYPYLRGSGVYNDENPLLDLPIDQPRDITTDRRFYSGPGIRSEDVPTTLARVTINVNDRTAADNRVLALHAGLVAVAQDDDGALQPRAGWHLTLGTIEIEDVIDRLIREQHTQPRTDDRGPGLGSSELSAIYDRIGSATLFDGAWTLLPHKKQRHSAVVDMHLQVSAIIDLADGKSICVAGNYRTEAAYVIVCRIASVEVGPASIRMLRVLDEPEDIPVYGTSLAFVLNAALDSGGDIAHVQTGWLSDLERTGQFS